MIRRFDFYIQDYDTKDIEEEKIFKLKPLIESTPTTEDLYKSIRKSLNQSSNQSRSLREGPLKKRAGFRAHNLTHCFYKASPQVLQPPDI